MAETTETPVGLSIPQGYAELPLDDIASTVKVLAEVKPEGEKPATGPVANAQ